MDFQARDFVPSADAAAYSPDATDSGAGAGDGMTGWFELRCFPVGGPGAAPDAVRCVAMHPARELVYAGTASGALHAHAAADAARIASTRPDGSVQHARLDPAVRAALVAAPDAAPDAVVVACASGVRVLSRGCASYGFIGGDGVADAAALAANPANDTQLAVGGGSSMIAVLDWATSRIIRQSPLRGGSRVTCAEWTDVGGLGSFAVFATATGRISVYDPSSMREASATAAYAGPVTSLDVRGTMLAACGMSMRGGMSFIEQTVKLFDIRAMHQPLASVPFPAGPVCVAFDNWVSSAITGGDALWALSPTGALQCLEIGGLQSGQGVIPVSNEIHLDADNDTFTTLSVSPEGLVICGDTGGFLHQWSASEYARLNAESEPIWEPELGPPSAVPPRPSFNIRNLMLSPVGATIPLSLLSMDRGLLSDRFVEAVARTSVQSLTGDQASGALDFSEIPETNVPERGVRGGGGGGRGRGRGGYTSGPKRGRPRPVDALGCARAPFSRFPPTIANTVLESAKWDGFVAYAKAPPGFVRNSSAGLKKPPMLRSRASNNRDSSASSRGSRTPSTSPVLRHGQPGSNGGMLYSRRDKSPSGRGGTDNTQFELSLSLAASAKIDPILQTPVGRSSYVEMDLVAWESVEGFDFLRYNQSGMFCGLENALPNVYVNAAVQALYFTPPFRNALSHHGCEEDVCISCELGFLFNMLDVGGAGIAVEAGNFTKSFMTMANAGALGLLDGSTSIPVASRIESFSSYLLEQLHMDAGGRPDTIISTLMGSDAISFGEFYPSREKWERKSRQFQHTLMYENSPSDFAKLVQASLHRELPRTRAFCPTTGSYETMSHSKRLASLPNLLLLGANSKATSFSSWWHGLKYGRKGGPESSNKPRDVHRIASEAMRRPTRLMSGLKFSIHPETLELSVSESQLSLDAAAAVGEGEPGVGTGEEAVQEESGGRDAFKTAYDMLQPGSDDDARVARDSGDLEAEYELSFVVARVAPSASVSGDRDDASSHRGNGADGHLVCYVRVPSSYREAKYGGEGSEMKCGADWWCFNDFVIAPCEGGWKEVAAFADGWKSPCLFGYTRRDVNGRLPPIGRPARPDIREVIGSGRCNAATGIERDEQAPGVGSLVGLDCEFVMTGREDCEITGDGRRTVVSPARMALARVSVVRGNGALIGVPLIDDYVEVKEPVVDYLTRWSGIGPGDLDPGRSPHTVRQLKTVYKKLLALVDAGVKFVGHGLKKDLRVLNFAVPADQVVDTVVLFREHNKRLLSLRFLVGTLLHEEIQAAGGDGHDSVEDAVAALRLHSAYEQLVERECFDETLKALYSYGYKHEWKASADEPFVIGG